MNHQAINQLVDGLPFVRSILESRYDRRFANNRHEQLYRGIFNTFEEAAASFPVARLGYDNDDSAQMYDDLADDVQPYDYPVMFHLQRLLIEHGTAGLAAGIFDYGGHVGVKRYAYGRFLDLPPWTVCDVPAVVRRGVERAFRCQQTDLFFTPDFSNVANKAVLLCLGSLQYIQHPLAQLLDRVPAAARPRHIILNTTAFTHPDDEAFYTLNNFGTAVAPYKVQNVGRFMMDMERIGYRMRDLWENPGRLCSVPFQTKRRDFRYLGMTFDRVGK